VHVGDAGRAALAADPFDLQGCCPHGRNARATMVGNARHVEEHIDPIRPYKLDDLGIRHLADVVPHISASAKTLCISIVLRAAVVDADTKALLPEVLQRTERHESYGV